MVGSLELCLAGPCLLTRRDWMVPSPHTFHGPQEVSSAPSWTVSSEDGL